MNPSIADLTRVFTRIGLMSFGGPAAQIAVMHRELVDDRPWLTERQFLNALSFCMLLPGPEAMQLCTYAGWRLRGVLGGVIAGLLFVLPGAVLMLALAYAYATWGQTPTVEALFTGIKAAVIIVVIQALFRLARKTLKHAGDWTVAVLSFAALFLFDMPFPLVILGAASYGLLRRQGSPSKLTADGIEAQTRRVALPRSLTQAATWLALWWLPIAAAAMFGADALVEIGLFFSKLAVVSFGGAYAVLAYMAQEAVTTQGWISPAQMMDGLGLAETTPGPLILVTEFVGYMAGHGIGGVGLAVAAALMTLWATFVPCFLWIFAAAPHVEWLTTRPRLAAALSAITAAVVGVIANLSLWFALHVFFNQTTPAPAPFAATLPVLHSVDLATLGLSCLAAGLLLWRGLALPVTLLIMAAAGAGVGFVSG